MLKAGDVGEGVDKGKLEEGFRKESAECPGESG